ncbi:MAG: FliA/WhiG family RNA polymerase sigma factor [Candidatus Gastranaerophilales bacterium]|nr:FliA/WhiG family RNA polymerase sigma factor [Candidatus Gastranaerophilales bacterium]
MSEIFETDSYKKVVRVSDEELAELWKVYQTDKTNKTVRDKLIVQYIYLTRYVIGRIKVNLPPNFSYEDILSYGIEGLIDAIEKYSQDRGAKFETYALMRIRGSIIDKIRANDWLPRTVRKKIKEVKDAMSQLKNELGRYPTNAEIGAKLNIEKEKVDEILAQDTGIGSLYDKKNLGDESVEIIDTIEDSKSERPDEAAEKKDAKKELECALKRLPERERMLLVLYYHENMTLKEIGETINVSESRVCQLHAQAIMKLRNILSSSRQERLSKSIIHPQKIRY